MAVAGSGFDLTGGVSGRRVPSPTLGPLVHGASWMAM